MIAMFAWIHIDVVGSKLLLIKKLQLFPFILSTDVQFWTLVELFQGYTTSGLAEFHHNVVGLFNMVVAEIWSVI